MPDLIIKATNLTKNYGSKKAIDDFSVSIPADGIIGLIGRNGSGKTTFMKLCAGLLNKTGGTVEVFGKEPMDNLEVLSNLTYTYHDLRYEKPLKLLSILQNYAVMFQSFDMEFALKLLKYFDLRKEMKYRYLSQGMASTFNFICGLSCRVPLTMFDEPVLGMDITVRRAAYEVLLREYNEHPRTIIISSHLLSELEGVLSDILLIDKGRMILHENIDDLRQVAYRIQGDKNNLDGFCKDKKVIYYKNGDLNSTAVIHEKPDELTMQTAKAAGLQISSVRAEDLCIYLTRENKEGQLECLWQKTN